MGNWAPYGMAVLSGEPPPIDISAVEDEDLRFQITVWRLEKHAVARLLCWARPIDEYTHWRNIVHRTDLRQRLLDANAMLRKLYRQAGLA